MSDLISRQEVLSLFAEKCDTVRPYHEVWQAVKELPSVEPEKCEDCISRKAATDRFDIAQSDDKCMGYDDIMAFLLSLPSVEPERKPGKWIPVYDDDGRCYDFRCSACNGADEYGSKFCPNCGTKMEADE